MKIFSYLYERTLYWSAHRHAPYYLAGVSFAESSFFPIPPDVMLVSMGLAMPKRSWQYALIATLCSVAGGILGYLIGMYAITFIQPWIDASSFAKSYANMVTWLKKGDVWIVILAGFTPFPYKVFTIAAGAMHIAFLPFVLGSFIGRGLRFFLVSGLLYFTGARIEAQLRRYIDIIGTVLLVLLLGAFCVIKWMW